MANPNHLEKALRGAKAWNAWRKKNPEIIIDFSGADFRQPDYQGISFAGFEFGDGANFSGSIFGDKADFLRSRFGDGANFSGSIFGDKADFLRSRFGDGANFSESRFGDGANFSESTFGDRANFSESRFGDEANFSESTFGDRANFSHSTFCLGVNFFGATFGYKANFSEAYFGCIVNFFDARFEIAVTFSGATFDGESIFSASTDASEEAHFFDISFENTTFHDPVDFSNRRFLGKTSFRHAVFKGVPFFHNCQLHQDTDFFGTDFQDTQSQGAARAYRTLKLAMQQQEATDEAHRFFILELKARQEEEWQHCERRKTSKKGILRWRRGLRWRALGRIFRKKAIASVAQVVRAFRKSPKEAMRLLPFQMALWLYGLLSDYGRSLLRPFLAWLGLGWVSYGLYSHFLMQSFFEWNGDIAAFALARGVPFFGSGRDDPLGDLEATFCPVNSACSATFYWVEMVAIGQSLFSVILIFLLLLAIRNRFKIK